MSTERSPAEALVGTILEGGYRIDGLVGEGGMGAVYEATHLRLRKRVAVKVMTRELAANSEALTRFHREAVVTAGLGDPHIVQVIDFNLTAAGEPFLVMEFLTGEDLDHRLRRARRLSPAQTIRIIKQVASALTTTHEKSIVHRDLKPANIYLVEAGGQSDFVKVLDFGISKVRTASTKLTKTSSIMGTPNYMSPEQAKGKIEDIDESTDQWALACIAWECLSGEGPFTGENVPSILIKIVHEPPPSLIPKVADLHPQVEDVLLRALAKNKSDRFASVNDFANALEAALAGPVPAVARTAMAAGTVQLAAAAGTVQLPPAAPEDDSVPRSAVPTTLSRIAVEMPKVVKGPPDRPKRWLWAAGFFGAMALLLGAFLLFRPGAAPKPVQASSPPLAAVPPPAKAALPAQQPKAEPPAAQAATPAANAAAEKKPEQPVAAPKPIPEPKAKKPLHAATPKPQASPLENAQPKPQPPEQPGKESERRWRLD